MNTPNYDRIIDLYLDGALNPVEEREFRNLLEIDPDLRQLLEAELAVRRTFEEDAEAVPVETERSYARFLAALASTAPAVDAANDAGASAATSAPRGPGGWLPAGFMKLAGAAVVTLGLATGGYFAVTERDSAPATSIAPAAAIGSPTTVERPAANATTRDAVTAPTDGITKAVEAPASTRALKSERATSVAERVPVDGAVAAPETKASPLVDPHDDLIELDENAARSEEDLPVIESDSVSTRVRLNVRQGR
jgi:hypothetical protein